jgi:thioredoxin reductase (NADPH)
MSLIESRREQIFPVLDAAQIAVARRFTEASPRVFAPGETIFSVGERYAPAWLILAGEIDITRRDGLNREAHVASMGPGQFTGEISELSGRGTLASGCGGPNGCTAVPFTAEQLARSLSARPSLVKC